MTNINEVFRNEVNYDNSESYKKQFFTLYLEDAFFGKAFLGFRNIGDI